MELRVLRYFQAVAEELSFSRAARRLRIAQPALSRAVQELERETGARLMERTRRFVRLTAAGTVLLQETGLLLERVEEAVRRVRRTAAGQEGELRLGYIGPPTRGFLGPLLAEYTRRFPRVSVLLEERTPERVWEMVAAGRLSAGLTRPVLAREALGLETLRLLQERLCAAIPEGHALAGRRTVPWKRLAREPVVLMARREGAGSHDTILASCLKAGFTPRIAHSPSLLGTVLRYVEAGAGIGIVPECATAEAAGSRLLFAPLTPARTIPLVLVWTAKGMEPPLQAFLDLAREWHAAGRLGPFHTAGNHSSRR
jgi:LysR family transcriptional regulator, benzoate and cis,cis-muconate-responsive activator of ben and cat genes